MATMFLESLKASFSDFLRPNFYQVTFTGNLFGEYEFGFLTKGATFPFMTYNTQQVMYNNLNRNFVQSIDYDPITFEFLVDDGLKVLRFFDSWRKLIMNDGSRTFNYKDEYSGNIEIELWNRKQFMRAKCIILDAYPVNIDNVPLAMDANDQIMTLSTSFRYDDILYEFDDGFSIAGVRDTIFDLAQGTIGTGIDAIKDGITSAANTIPDSAVKNVFGGIGQPSGGFAGSEEALASQSKEVFSGTGGGGTGVANATRNARLSKSTFTSKLGGLSNAGKYAKNASQIGRSGGKAKSIISKIKSWSPFG